MFIRIGSEFMATEVDGVVVASALWSWYPAANGSGAWHDPARDPGLRKRAGRTAKDCRGRRLLLVGTWDGSDGRPPS